MLPGPSLLSGCSHQASCRSRGSNQLQSCVWLTMTAPVKEQAIAPAYSGLPALPPAQTGLRYQCPQVWLEWSRDSKKAERLGTGTGLLEGLGPTWLCGRARAYHGRRWRVVSRVQQAWGC